MVEKEPAKLIVMNMVPWSLCNSHPAVGKKEVNNFKLNILMSHIRTYIVSNKQNFKMTFKIPASCWHMLAWCYQVSL